MRRINYFGKELTVEQFIKKEICKNAGTQSIAFKEQLQEICKNMGLVTEKMKKDELFDLMIAGGCTYEQLAADFHVGVSSQNYQHSFGITHQEVKRLEKHGALTVVGTYKFRAYGKYIDAPLYDVYQFAKMTDEQMQGLLAKYPKRKSKP